MSLTIPLRSDVPFFDLQVELDGQTYGFKFAWNFIAECWFMSLYDAEGQPIAQGLKVVVDFPLGARCKTGRMPPGILQAMDTSGKQIDPGLTDLGQRVILLYFTAGELG